MNNYLLKTKVKGILDNMLRAHVIGIIYYGNIN